MTQGRTGPSLQRTFPAVGVTQLTLNRPSRLNALDPELIGNLHESIEAIATDASCRVVVLTGHGRGFCSGLDISGEDPLGMEDDLATVLDRQERIAQLPYLLWMLPQPVIAAVNGAAAGAGLALALASDIRLCSPSATFSAAFIKLGVSSADLGVSYLLPQIVGTGHASYIMLTGHHVPAIEAKRIGLVNEVIASDELLSSAIKMAEEIGGHSPLGVRMTKRVLADNVDAPSLGSAIELENRTQALLVRTRDAAEALDAFLTGRSGVFLGY